MDKFQASFLSLNVRGLNDNKKRRKIFSWCTKQNTDIVFLQETYSTAEVENICAPTADRPCQPNFFRRLKSILLKNSISLSKLIVGGDFNCVINSELDRKREAEAKSTSKDYSTVSGELIDILKDTLDLSDAWRVKNPDKKRFTWHRKKPTLTFSRLDYWLTSDYLFDAITSIDIVCAPFTDHSAITLFLNNAKEQIRGRGYWKFNSCFLKEKEYVELVPKVYEDYLSEFEEVQDKRLRWDLVKYKLRQASIDFGKTKAQSQRHKEEYISEQLKDLEQKLA